MMVRRITPVVSRRLIAIVLYLACNIVALGLDLFAWAGNLSRPPFGAAWLIHERQWGVRVSTRSKVRRGSVVKRSLLICDLRMAHKQADICQ